MFQCLLSVFRGSTLCRKIIYFRNATSNSSISRQDITYNSATPPGASSAVPVAELRGGDDFHTIMNHTRALQCNIPVGRAPIDGISPRYSRIAQRPERYLLRVYEVTFLLTTPPHLLLHLVPELALSTPLLQDILNCRYV